MSKQPLSPQTLLSQHPEFAKLLERATCIADEILSEVGEDAEELERATVTLHADFVLDVMDTLVAFAAQYEDFDPDDIVGMLELQRSYQHRYNSDGTRH